MKKPPALAAASVASPRRPLASSFKATTPRLDDAAKADGRRILLWGAGGVHESVGRQLGGDASSLTQPQVRRGVSAFNQIARAW